MLTPVVEAPPRLERARFGLKLADILRAHGADTLRTHNVSHAQRRVLQDILQCRTAALGGHVDACEQCGGLRIRYNSCRHRHCPQCGGLARAAWLEAQQAHLLPIPYFHVVFTLDHAWNPLARDNPVAVYNLLFHAAAETLHTFGARYLKGEIGFSAVLHTWGQTLSEHIHLHCIVTGGALSADGRRRQAASRDYLFPIKALSRHFRDRFCAGLSRLYQRGALHLAGESLVWVEPAAFEASLQASRRRAWEVYAKPPFAGAEDVLAYLGRYVNRIAISQGRLLELRDGQVRFSYRDYRHQGRRKEMTLKAEEFIRRFLQHVLPPGFTRIRHYGLLAPRYRASKLARCRALLAATPPPPPRSKQALLAELTGDNDCCPVCGQGHWRLYQTLPPQPTRLFPLNVELT